MRFIPKEGKEYWHITRCGDVFKTAFIKDYEIDTHRIKSGNCYKTEAEAVKSRDRQYAFVEVKDYYEAYAGKSVTDGEFYFNLNVNDEFTNLAKEKFGSEKLKLIMEE